MYGMFVMHGMYGLCGTKCRGMVWTWRESLRSMDAKGERQPLLQARYVYFHETMRQSGTGYKPSAILAACFTDSLTGTDQSQGCTLILWTADPAAQLLDKPPRDDPQTLCRTKRLGMHGHGAENLSTPKSP